MLRRHHNWFIVLCLVLAGCAADSSHFAGDSRRVLRLAVTTSTRDSGLLDLLIPRFESRHGARVDVIAVGTGAAMKLGESGDVDLVLVHAREAEQAFMAAGHGIRREEVMYNMFVILGPQHDPAGIRGKQPVEALRGIVEAGQRFVSRGDESGTHQRERQLWQKAGGVPQYEGYVESGQGMGATLIIADEWSAYVLSDSGTYLKLKSQIGLVPLVSSSEELRNPYGIIAVNPDKHPRIDSDLAQRFIDFMISSETQQLIGDYVIEGRRLFYPLRLSNQD